MESLKKHFETVPLEKQGKDIRIIEAIKAVGFYWRFVPFLVWLGGAHLIFIPVMFFRVHLYGFPEMEEPFRWLAFLVLYLIVTWILLVPLAKKFLEKQTRHHLKKIEKITSTNEGKKSLQKIKRMHPYYYRTLNSAKKRKFYHWLFAP